MTQSTDERVRLTASDGATVSAYHATPAGARRGGIVVVQEIFGVNAHIRSVADRFSQAGYEVLAPALFDRVEPNVELGYEGDTITQGRAYVARIGLDNSLLDIAAAVRWLAPRGKVGVVGYCYGGTLAFLSAAKVAGLSAAVGYYGTAIAKNLDGNAPRVPTLLHYGERDRSTPPEDIARVRAAYPEIEVHTYPAEHGFNCDQRSAYSEESAHRALDRTLAFFAEHVG